MNDNAKKWIEALRSGEFKQGTDALNPDNGDTYCCLGVACVVYQRETGDGEFIDDGGMFESEVATPGYRDSGVPGWVGLPIDQISKCIYMNDGEHATFDQIADYLEEVLA